MEFIKLIFSNGRYIYEDASNIAMNILGTFLARDIKNITSFKEYAHNKWEQYTSSNLTALEKENGYILLSDLYSEEIHPTELKMTYSQFLQILNDWEEKVLNKKPKEVFIKYENDQFIFETKD